jgi:hypothetical protein
MKTDSTKTKKKSTSPSRPRSYTPLSDALGNPTTFVDTELAQGTTRYSLVGLLRGAISRKRRKDCEPLNNVLAALLVWPLLNVPSLLSELFLSQYTAWFLTTPSLRIFTRSASKNTIGYLHRDRGVRTEQRVFLRTYAPRVPLTGPASIGHIVRSSMVRAGVDRPTQIAAHLFRHTLASRMLQQGASLRDISEVLRHRAQGSTEIYAKIDMGSLEEVIRPWPARGGAR